MTTTPGEGRGEPHNVDWPCLCGAGEGVEDAMNAHLHEDGSIQHHAHPSGVEDAERWEAVESGSRCPTAWAVRAGTRFVADVEREADARFIAGAPSLLARAEAAEAERDRLRLALVGIAGTRSERGEEMRQRAEDALAALDRQEP